RAVDIGQHAVAERQILSADRFDLGSELPRFAQLGLVSVGPAQGGERAELKPAGVEFGGTFAVKSKSADVTAPQRKSGEARMKPDRNLLTERGKGHVDVPRPERCSVTLGPGERRAT